MSLGIYTTYSFALSAVRTEVEYEKLWFEISNETGIEVAELKRYLHGFYGHRPNMEQLQAIKSYWGQHRELPEGVHQVRRYF